MSSARDILWAPGMTLPDERMNNLSCTLRGYGNPVPRLVNVGASTDQIADAVFAYMGSLQPDPTWGWQLINPSDHARVQSVLSREDVHWIQYDGGYHDPMLPTMVALFICNLGPLPEDEEQPEAGDHGPRRYCYRWRVRVSIKNSRPYVKVEKLQQLQTYEDAGHKNPDGSEAYEWKIYNTNGQNQLYAFQPDTGNWWSGADFGDWITTHATDIADVVQYVALAIVTVVTFGAGAPAVVGVGVIKAVTEVLKSVAIAAALGQKFDIGKFLSQMASIAAALAKVPGVSAALNKISEWVQQAGEDALNGLMSNGIFSAFLASGSGIFTDLKTEGEKLYAQVKGLVDSEAEVIAAAKNFVSVAANPQQVSSMIDRIAPSQIKVFLDPLMAQLAKEIPDPKKLVDAGLKLLQQTSGDLQRRIEQVKTEALHARDILPDHLKPWFDFGVKGQLEMSQAPFYAVSAVQFGQGSRDLQNAVLPAITAAKANVDAQADLFAMIKSYGLVERYQLLELLDSIAPRYAGK